MPIKLKNNATGLLATSISASDTGLVLQAGNGAAFSALGAGEYFYATLASAGGTLEIVKVTARVGDTMTVVRAQEGTSAAGFAAGSRLEQRVTAQSVIDAVGDVVASQVGFTPTGGIAATDVQAALAEVDSEKIAFTRLDDSDGSSLVGFLQAGLGAVVRTAQAKMRDIVSVKDFGAVGDGVADDTVAIQAAIDSLTTGQALIFQSGKTYKIGQVIFNGKSVAVMAHGAKFTLSGSSAGFVVKGITAGFFVYGGTITGDGVNRDGALSTMQIGWLFGNEVGAYVQNVWVEDVVVDAANIGFKFAAGTGSGSGNTNYVKVNNCQAKDIVGLVGGSGYGFQFSQANNSTISNSVAINCGRHGIYFAEGRNYAAVNCIVRDHRSTVFTAAYRAAMSLSRSRNVTVSNCVFDNCYDGTIAIDTDPQGTPPDNVSIGTVVNGCTFLNSALADIRIGTVPAIDGVVYDVVVSNCVFVRASGNAVSPIVVEGGERIKITDNFIDASAAAATVRAITLGATSGATYTNDVEIVRNTINSAGYGVQIESALKTGTTRVRVLDNKITATTAELDFVGAGGEDTITNNNLIYNRTNNKNALRTYTSSGSDVIIPVGGIDYLTLSASGATTVSNFSGGTEGQELTLYFTNGNTTLKATNLYLAGAVDFVGSQHDILSLVYLGGAWREKCRSLN